MICASPRLRVDVGIDPYKCATLQICMKLRADMESAPTVHHELAADCRGARPLRFELIYNFVLPCYFLVTA